MTRAGQAALIPHARNPFEWLIEKITRSPVHHVIVAVDDDTVVSAEIPRVRYRPTSHFPDAIWSDFDLTDTQSWQIVGFAQRQVGKRYALGDDILIGVALLTGTHTPAWIERRLNDQRRWMCSELVAAAYDAGGIDMFPETPMAAVYPGMFVPVWKRHGWWPTTLGRTS